MWFNSYTDDDSSYPLFVRIQNRFRQRASEWVTSFQVALLGLVLLFSSSIATNSAFQLINSMGVNTIVLGLCTLLLGLSRLISLFINGAKKQVTPVVRMSGAFLGFVLFTTITCAYIVSTPFGVWAAAWPIAACMELVNIFRSSRDMKDLRANA